VADNAILDCPMSENDSGATTIRGYLIALLAGVWAEEEGFSGKRPFGNSGWKYDIYDALAKAGLIQATLDEDGFIDQLDDDQKQQAHKLIVSAINVLDAT
jgi:hypothetical protein